MNLCKIAMLAAGALLAAAAPSHASPCSQRLDAMQIEIDAKLNAAAAAGPSGNETTAATDHRQPTPKSIAAAELKLGDISPETVRAVGEAMARARKADSSGDAAACEQALVDAQHALGK